MPNKLRSHNEDKGGDKGEREKERENLPPTPIEKQH